MQTYASISMQFQDWWPRVYGAEEHKCSDSQLSTGRSCQSLWFSCLVWTRSSLWNNKDASLWSLLLQDRDTTSSIRLTHAGRTRWELWKVVKTSDCSEMRLTTHKVERSRMSSWTTSIWSWRNVEDWFENYCYHSAEIKIQLKTQLSFLSILIYQLITNILAHFLDSTPQLWALWSSTTWCKHLKWDEDNFRDFIVTLIAHFKTHLSFPTSSRCGLPSICTARDCHHNWAKDRSCSASNRTIQLEFVSHRIPNS